MKHIMLVAALLSTTAAPAVANAYDPCVPVPRLGKAGNVLYWYNPVGCTPVLSDYELRESPSDAELAKAKEEPEEPEEEPEEPEEEPEEE